MAGGIIAGRVYFGMSSAQDQHYKDANEMVSESVTNHQTIGSFGHIDHLISKYMNLLETPKALLSKKAHISGIVFGFSESIALSAGAIQFWCAAYFLKQMKDSTTGPADAIAIFISLNAVRFASFAAGQAQQFGPQVGQGLTAATKIFGIIDVHSEIDPMADPT